MLNLTKYLYKLRSPSGEVHTLQPSGYVARVEKVRETVDIFGIRQAKPTHAEDDDEGACLPVVEETVTGIAFDWNGPGIALFGIMWQGTPIEEAPLLLVTREVAEAAALRLWIGPAVEGKYNLGTPRPHPLASRMVWTIDWHATQEDPSISGTAYHALQRVPHA